MCRDIYKDPVLLPCSHSLCNACVTRWWKTKGSRECPVCKTVSPTKKTPKNLVLRNLCEAFSLEMESGTICRLHTERLKLYCQEHRAPVCVVCRESQQHRGHSFTPVDEAAEFHRNHLRDYLSPLREKVKVFSEAKANLERTDEEIKSQAEDAERRMKEEFRALQDFLQREERARVAALKEEERRKRQGVKDKLDLLTREIHAMESTIESLEGGLADDDTSFLLKVDALTTQAQRPLLDAPQQAPGALIDVARYLGNVRFSVWYKMKEMVSYSPVILDPKTAHRELYLSKDLTSLRSGPSQTLAVIPERMEHHHCVLGSEGFSSGSHCWDVETGENQVWALGVITQGARRTGDITSGLWMLRFCYGKFTIFSPSCPVSALPLKDRLQRIRVHLDLIKGRLTFWDPDTSTILHTFTHTFTDKLFPYINTWHDLPLKILPVKLSVIAS